MEGGRRRREGGTLGARAVSYIYSWHTARITALPPLDLLPAQPEPSHQREKDKFVGQLFHQKLLHARRLGLLVATSIHADFDGPMFCTVLYCGDYLAISNPKR